MSLQEFCDAEGLELTWQQSDLKHTIHPDAYFFITDPRKESKNTNHFFLEVERQKMGNMKDGKPSIIRKAERYYRHYNTDLCQREWGFKMFRIITIQKNDIRRQHFLTALQQQFNHRMFWLGTEANRTADFLTPKGDTFSFSDL